MSVLDSHTDYNKFMTQSGLSNKNADVIGEYKKAMNLTKTMINFDIHCKMDLRQHLSEGMELEKAWQTWVRFTNTAFSQKHIDKTVDNAINAYIKDGVKGMLKYIYHKNRKIKQ